MKKITLLLTGGFIAVLTLVGVPKLIESNLNLQKNGWIQAFKLLDKRTLYCQKTLNNINKQIKNQYVPIISSNKIIKNFGIGGSVYSFDPSAQIVQKTQKDIKITNAIATVTAYKLENIAAQVHHYKDSLLHTPMIHPIPVDSIYAISSFGLRVHPILHKLMMHDGIDYAAEVGTPVFATADGIVIKSTYDKVSGRYIKIAHGFGYATIYAHLSKSFVHVGDKVHRGQIIGLVGNTGRSVGPHLHYEIKLYGVPVNPAKYIINPTPAEKICRTESKYSKSFIFTR